MNQGGGKFAPFSIAPINVHGFILISLRII
jgi:hypothetical protein